MDRLGLMQRSSIVVELAPIETMPRIIANPQSHWDYFEYIVFVTQRESQPRLK